MAYISTNLLFLSISNKMTVSHKFDYEIWHFRFQLTDFHF